MMTMTRIMIINSPMIINVLGKFLVSQFCKRRARSPEQGMSLKIQPFSRAGMHGPPNEFIILTTPSHQYDAPGISKIR